MATPTKSKIEQLARVLFPRFGIKDVGSLIATIVKHRSRDGHAKIWRPEGGWGWFAAPGATSVTPSMVTLSFPSDYRRTAAEARADLYRQLEDAAYSVMSEDEIEAILAQHGKVAGQKKSGRELERDVNDFLTQSPGDR